MLGLIAFVGCLAALSGSYARSTADQDTHVNLVIVGGQNASIGDFPYQVAMLVFDQPACGGSIISRQFVLTAAHCTEPVLHQAPPIKFRVGSTDNLSGGKLYAAWQVNPHPSYNGRINQFDYDVAVVRIIGSFEFGPGIRPITLVAANRTPSPGSVVTVSGWGNEELQGAGKRWLQEVSANIVSQATCRSYYRQLYNDRLICVKADLKKGSCQGDSGGPLVNLERNTQVGIVSGGHICGESPSMYTNVAHGGVRNFIRMISGV